MELRVLPGGCAMRGRLLGAAWRAGGRTTDYYTKNRHGRLQCSEAVVDGCEMRDGRSASLEVTRFSVENLRPHAPSSPERQGCAVISGLRLRLRALGHWLAGRVNERWLLQTPVDYPCLHSLPRACMDSVHVVGQRHAHACDQLQLRRGCSVSLSCHHCPYASCYGPYGW